ncbi:hypothetical protein Hanom_Chr00s170766g01828711 [Helianthus anomalus]
MFEKDFVSGEILSESFRELQCFINQLSRMGICHSTGSVTVVISLLGPVAPTRDGFTHTE